MNRPSMNPDGKPAASSPAAQPARRIVPWLAAALLAALVVAGLWPKPPLVETTRVAVGPMRVTVDEEGRTRLRQRHVLASPVAGRLRRIAWKAGDEVVADTTVIAVLEPLASSLLDPRSRALAEARRDVAAATLDRAREAHRFAALERGRFERLAREQVVSRQELEGVQWRETAASRDLLVAEGSLRQAEAELREFDAARSAGPGSPRPIEIRSPVSGRVLRVLEESERVVSPGTPLAEVGDPADLEAVVDVLSRDGAAVDPGTRVELEQWGGPHPLQGRVRLVEPSAFTKVSALGVEEQRVHVVVDILTPAAERKSLGDQFRVEGRIVVWEDPKALKVHSGALVRTGNGWAAQVLRQGRVSTRPVKVGRIGGNETQVLEGLSEGDEVVLYPGDRLKDGQRARVTVVPKD